MSGFTHEPPAGGSPEWYTPPALFQRLGLTFDLDPCAPPPPAAGWLPVARRYSRPQDGLALPWEGRVWLNPPYATETGRWVRRLAEHRDGIALVFARVDTPWWQDAARRATVVCFIQGRVNFIPGGLDPAKVNRSQSRAGAPSCLLAYGTECAAAVLRSELGLCLGEEPSYLPSQLAMT